MSIIMAALLRFGGASACRLLAVYTVRNPQIYRRFRLNAYKQHILKACRPSVGALRHLSLSSDSEASSPQVLEADEEASAGTPSDFTPKEKISEGEYKYRRDVKNLGTITLKNNLVSIFKEILKREGAVSSFQAYQILRNCVSKLVYEKPQERIDLAHYFWDKMVATGVTPDAMLYNALLSVYIYNNHTFNPMEVLEQMKKQDVEANRTTLVLLMQAFGEMGDVAGTFKVLEFIKAVDMPLTEEVFASLITAYGFSGDFENAKGVFDLMRENGLEPDIGSYIALLCVYGDKGDIDAINKTIDEMQEKRVYPNQNVFVTLLNLLSRRGHVTILKELLEKPMILSLLQGDLKNLMVNVATRGELNSAFAMLEYISPQVLSSSGVGGTLPGNLPADTLLLRTVVYSEQPLELVLITINELERLGVMKNIHETALEYSFNLKRTELSLEILKEMLRKGIPVKTHYFYPILARHATDENPQEAQAVMDLMTQNGFELDPMSLKYLVRSFGQPDMKDVEAFISMTQDIQLSPFFVRLLVELVMQTGQLDLLSKLIGYAKKESVDPLYVMQAFQTRLRSSFDPQTAVQTLKILDNEDYVAESTPGMISGCITSCSESRIQDMLSFVVLVHKEGLHHHLESKSYTFMMRRLCHAKMSDDFYEFVRMMKQYNVELDSHHYRQLIKMMAFDGKSDAANFCFEKYQAMAEPDGLVYSSVIQAFGSCPEGGVLSRNPKQRNIKQICRLFREVEEKQLLVTNRAKGYTIIANLLSGNIEEAERIRKRYGPGEPEYRVHSELLRAYSRRGNVAKCQELFEKVKSLTKVRAMPPFVFNNMLHVYGFHGDYKSQREILKEMEQQNVQPNAYSYAELMKSLLMKDNIKLALEVFEEAKEKGTFTSDSACLLLLNSMSRTGQTEHFESALDTVLTTTRRESFGQRWSQFLLGLMFCCLHAGRKDLVLKLQLEYDVKAYSRSFTHYATSSASRGEVDAILNVIQFMKESGISHGDLYLPLIKAYDARRDPKSAQAVYEQLKAEGVEPPEDFLHVLDNIIKKYSEPVAADLQKNSVTSSLEKHDSLEANAANDELSREEDSSHSDSGSDSEKA